MAKGQLRNRLQEEVEILEVQWEEWCVLLYTWLGAYGTGRYRCQQAEEAEV